MRKRRILLWVGIGLIILFLVAVVGLLPRFSLGRAKMARLSGERSYDVGLVRNQEALFTTAEKGKSGAPLAGSAQPSIPRKLIRRAELNLEVQDCQAVSEKIAELADKFSGIILDSHVQKYPNEAKRGYTILKVPPKDFAVVLVQLKALGKVELERVTGEDVTEEYIDLEARLKNAQVVKVRLVKILDERAREVKDILEVERELGRVSESIEQLKGRMQYLDRQVDLATITVNYYEPKALTPEPLNVLKRFKQTIRTAIEAFINVFNGAIVVIAAVLPVVIWLSIIIGIVLGVRKLFLKK